MLSTLLLLCVQDAPVVTSMRASASQEGNPVEHLWDGDLETRWAARGRGQWVELTFDQAVPVRVLELAPYLGDVRSYRVAFEVPEGDGWRRVGATETTPAPPGLVELELPTPVTTRALRLVFDGSNLNDWNTIWELRVPGVEPPPPPPPPALPRPSHFQVRRGLAAEVFGEDPQLASPVAVSVGRDGVVHVTETQRRKKQNLDIRNNTDWTSVELALGSVAEKERFLRATLTPERSAENRRRVDDYNRDGSHDWRDLAVVPDRVHRLVDLDGDGGADAATVLTDDLRGVVSGVAAGVLAHRGEVFVTQCPGVYRYRDRDGDGVADERATLAEGFGVHIAYGGHNMHGLVVGPDGRLYWSIGDIGSDAHPWEGAVFRCWPDGSEFEVVARGLRNPQELAFDEFGDLHTGDNDGDFGDRERWIHVLEGADYGWRMHYQLQTRGWGSPTGDYSMWIEDALWRPEFPGRATWTQPPVANIADGPCGLTYYPGVGLDESFDGTFFLAHFRGGTNSSVRTYQLEPDGATWALASAEDLFTDIAVTGLDWGPDGALYVCDWINGWDVKEEGRVHRVFDPARVEDGPRRETQTTLAQDWSAVEPARLVELLGHPSLDVRLEAQYELAARGAEGAPFLLGAATRGEGRPRRHGVWGLAQVARAEPGLHVHLRELLGDADPEVRAQAARVVGDLRDGEAAGRLLTLAGSEEAPRALFFQLQALARLADVRAVPLAVEVLGTLGEDLALRHSAMRVLEQAASRESLVELARHGSTRVRSAAVVALRRRGDAGVARYLDDPEPAVVLEAARAIHDAGIAGAAPALARLTERPFVSAPLTRRVLAANLGLGDDASAARVAALAARADVGEAMRVEALEVLLAWEEPSPRDRVTGAWRPLEPPTRHLNVAREALRPHLAALLAGPAAVQARAAQLAERHGLAVDVEALAGWVADEALPGATRLAAFDLLVAREALNPALLERALLATDPGLVARAVQAVERRDPARAVSLISRAVAGDDVPRAQALLDVLAASTSPEARALAEGLLTSAESPPSALALELRAAARAHGLDAPDDPDYLDCLEGGDPLRGRAVFLDSARTQCMRCHQAGDLDGRSGPDVGPDLTGVGRERGRAHLLASILEPDAEIREEFDRQQVLLTDGTSVVGRLVEETETRLVLEGRFLDEPAELPAYRIELELAEVDARRRAQSPMPAQLVDTMSRRELRDLIAYLMDL